MTAKRTAKRTRSAETGQYVPAAEAEKHPATTVTETGGEVQRLKAAMRRAISYLSGGLCNPVLAVAVLRKALRKPRKAKR